MLEIYTYLGNDAKRRRYTELPIMLLEDLNIYPRFVTIPELIQGVSWESEYLSKEYVDIPYKIVKKIEDIIEDIQLGKIWSDLNYEEIEVKPEVYTSSKE